MPNFFSNIFRQNPRPSETVGSPGTVVIGGYAEEDESNSRLTGITKYKTYSDMIANTAIISAGIRFYLNVIARATWNVEAADGSEQASELADKVKDMMHDMETPWHRVVRRASMYRFYGFGVQEWTAKKTSDGVISFLDVAPRAQKTIERWDIDESGRVQGVIQRDPVTAKEIYLPRWKIFYLVDDSLNDSPEGLGVLRNLVRSAEKLKRYEDLEGFGFETDLRGIPVARVPYGELQQMVDDGAITTEYKKQLTSSIEMFIKNHIKNPQLGLLLDSVTYQNQDDSSSPSSIRKWDVELLKSGSSSQGEVYNTIERLNREIARILGVEGLLLGSSSQGSQALSRDKSDNFLLLIDSVLLELSESFNKDFINTIWRLNGWDDNLKPKFKVAINQREISDITTALSDLASSGASIMPDDPIINEIRDMLGLSAVPNSNDSLINNDKENSNFNQNEVIQNG